MTPPREEEHDAPENYQRVLENHLRGRGRVRCHCCIAWMHHPRSRGTNEHWKDSQPRQFRLIGQRYWIRNVRISPSRSSSAAIHTSPQLECLWQWGQGGIVPDLGSFSPRRWVLSEPCPGHGGWGPEFSARTPWEGEPGTLLMRGWAPNLLFPPLRGAGVPRHHLNR